MGIISTMVVVVTDVTEVQQAFASALGKFGMAPILASTVQEALSILSKHPISLIFCSDELPGDGPDVLIKQIAIRVQNRVPVVIVSRLDDLEWYLDSLHYEAFGYVLYPLRHREIERVVKNMRNLRTRRFVVKSDSAENPEFFSHQYLN